MIKVGIMQPYFFPYIGYWQLLNAVDKYVVYDDVNYIKGGWINRNRILNNGKVQYINIQMKGASAYKHINEIECAEDSVFVLKNIKALENIYGKAPYFSEAFPIIVDILQNKETNLAKYLIFSIHKICAYLSIDTYILISSEIEKNETLKGKDRVIDICKRLNATDYYNPIGGVSLYSNQEFKENGIDLHFLKTREITYKQGKNEFIGNLSIIDIMMYNSKENVKKMLLEYDLEQ